MVEQFETKAAYEASNLCQEIHTNWRLQSTKKNKNEVVKEFWCKFSHKKVGFRCGKKMKVVLSSLGSVKIKETDNEHKKTNRLREDKFTTTGPIRKRSYQIFWFSTSVQGI